MRRAIACALTGASDHLVSEAIYLDDPEGNGIEVYRDRLPEEWRWNGDRIQMATDRLDLDNLAADAGNTAYAGAPDGLRIGHIHLRVGDLGATQTFYCDTIGLDPTAGRGGALFMSSGRYHHHVGSNVWHSAGAGQRDDDRARACRGSRSRRRMRRNAMPSLARLKARERAAQRVPRTVPKRAIRSEPGCGSRLTPDMGVGDPPHGGGDRWNGCFSSVPHTAPHRRCRRRRPRSEPCCRSSPRRCARAARPADRCIEWIVRDAALPKGVRMIPNSPATVRRI